ncbi:MAG: hypothetical protein AB2693_25565 [Candidatus Thiodiazotropha sp.]
MIYYKSNVNSSVVYNIIVAMLVTVIGIALLVAAFKYRKRIAGYCPQKKKTASRQLPQIKHTIYRPKSQQSYEMETRSDNSDYLEPMQVYRPTVESLLSSSTTIYQEIV